MSNKMIKIENISKSFDGVSVLENLNLYIRENEFLTLLGPSGCGKTTLLRILGGFEEPDTGRILFEGKDISLLAPNKRPLNTVFQKDTLFYHMSVADNIAFGLKIKGQTKSYIQDKVHYALHLVGLDGFGERFPDSLSGGMCQRAALLRTYLSSQGIALLDEPFSALDTLTRTAMHRWYLGVMREISLSTLFITHDIDEAILLSDRIYIMTGRPGVLSEEIPIEAPRPRSTEYTLTEEFLRYKRLLTEKLA